MVYAELNRYLEPTAGNYNDAWRRVFGRLGDYTQIILQALNLRPKEVVFWGQTEKCLLIRLSLPTKHLILRLAPEDDLTSELYFGREMANHRLPAARITHFDLKRGLVPFSYLVEDYVGGIKADQLETPHLLQTLARQVGRTLRQMHRIEAPGWERPNPTGRWLTPDWPTTLLNLHTTLAPAALATPIFGPAIQAHLKALLADPLLAWAQPRLLHGNLGPAAVCCTTGDQHVHLEALIAPGKVVAGDGLFDLAWGLSLLYPQAWRTGLLQGYTLAAPLSLAEQQRLHLLQLLVAYWQTCQAILKVQPSQDLSAQTLKLFQQSKKGIAQYE